MAEPLLLDTTYLLRVFGIDVGLPKFESELPRVLNEYDVRYNPISLPEAKWISLRMSRGDREDFLRRHRAGLSAILTDKRMTQTQLTNGEIELVADRLLIERGSMTILTGCSTLPPRSRTAYS